MTFTLYSQLKQQIVLGVASSEKPNQILTKLKESYRNQINSPRKYEQIDSVGQLLITLEKRDLLSENNVEILKEIAQSLFNRDLISKINDYENNHQPTEYLNYYGEFFIPTFTFILNTLPWIIILYRISYLSIKLGVN